MSEHLSRKEKKHPDSRCSTKLEALSAWQQTLQQLFMMYEKQLSLSPPRKCNVKHALMVRAPIYLTHSISALITHITEMRVKSIGT